MKHSAVRLLNLFAFPLILTTIAAVLCIQNYTPGTFLSGWDALHPEFDFRLNTLRTLFGVFRPEQGLGAVAAHAHMVELPRIFILYLLDIFYPLAALRYLYFFICLISGPIGMYFFLQRILIKKKVPSFLGALFYLLNLGTYQTFVVPFEMFTTLYATLPFIYWLIAEYLNKHKKRVLVFFSIAVIFTSPAAYASILWFVFFASILIFFIPYLLIKAEKGMIKRFMILIGILLVLNLYWLLPNIYFAATTGSQVTSANINKLFTEEAFLKNKEFGNIVDILLLKSFYFDWGIYNNTIQGFEQLTTVFQKHLSNTYISAIGLLFSSFIIFGLIYSAKKTRQYFPSFAAILLFCLLFLMNVNQPFTYIFTFFQEHVPLFKEAARFPDNKIFNIYIFMASIFISYTMLFILTRLKNRFGSILISTFTSVALTSLLIIYMLPAFNGHLIHQTMRTTIPVEYFSLFEYLKNEPTGRIANFPVQSPWGWVYHNWYDDTKPSFQGAGFLYFGVKQPILERDFDRWNPKNEQYYREISHAVYTQSEKGLMNVIEKYDISHLLVDRSVMNAAGDNKNLYINELTALLEKLSIDKFIAGKKDFGSFLTVYTVKNPTPLISTLKNVQITNPYVDSYYKDDRYEAFSDYISTNENNGLIYPLNEFISNDSKVIEGKIKTNDQSIQINLPKGTYNTGETDYRQNIIPANILASLTSDSTTNNLSVNLYPITPLLDGETLLAPITGSFEYPNTATPLLSVNRQVVPLNTLQINTPTVVGSVFLSPSLNQIALFDNSRNTVDYRIDEIPFSFGYCNNFNNADLNIAARPDSLVLLRPQQEAVCISLPLSFIRATEEESTVLLSLRFTTKNNSHITACLTHPENGTCNEYLPINSDSGSHIQFAINKSELSYTKLILTVEKGSQEQTLENLKVNSSQAASETLLDSTYFISTIPKEFTKVEIPRITDQNYFAVAQKSQSYENDCKSPQNKSSKSFDDKDSSYKYDSTTGSYCDHISFPNLPHYLAYLVYIKSKNEVGLPLTLCITNYTSRKCDIFSKLTKFTEAKDDVFLLPPSDFTGTGYDINIENIGIKNSPAINRLYSATFVPIPLSFLSQIRKGTNSSLSYSGTITNAVFNNPHFMTMEVKDTPALITLSYAHNPAFKAYNITCTEGLLCSFGNFIRPIFGNALEHVTVSSWKNAWIAPDSGPVLIVFLPQYLEYLGILALVIFMTIIIFYPILNHYLKNRLDDYFDRKAVGIKNRISEILKK